MYIVAIAWIFVVLLMSLAEGLSSQGSVLGAILTFVLYGVLPLSIVLYLMGTPMRRNARRRRESAADGVGNAVAETLPKSSADSLADGDGRSHSTAAAVAPVREES